MVDNRLKFTKRALEALPPAPPGKRVDYNDIETPGLVLRISETGNKSFSLFRRIKGRPERITLGRFPAMTVEQARNEVKKLLGEVARGANPAEEKRGIRQELTLGELFHKYPKNHAKLHKATWAEDEGMFNSHLAQWQNKKLPAIRRTDVQSLHAKIGAHAGTKIVMGKNGRNIKTRTGGPGAANHMLRLLRTLFNKAALWGWEGANPAQGIKEFPNPKRDRFLEKDELPNLFKALLDEPNETAKDYFLAALFTGVRKENTLAMRWDQINLERETWFIPKTKNGEAQTVPLVPVLLDLLRWRKEQATSPWVFPGSGASGHYVNPDPAWKRIVSRAGIKDTRGTWTHDLRRSLGSWQAATGANLSVIGKTLNHKNASTTAIYARLNIEPVRESMEKATAAMMQAGGLLGSGDVVDIQRKQG